MKNRILTALAAAALLAGSVSTLAEDATNADLVARGRYLVLITGCNDCHTPSYAASMGQVVATSVVQFPAPPAD